MRVCIQYTLIGNPNDIADIIFIKNKEPNYFTFNYPHWDGRLKDGLGSAEMLQPHTCVYYTTTCIRYA